MQFIFDHIIAILITSVIVLILHSIQFLSLETNVDEVSNYAAKETTLDLAEIIQEDFNLTLHRYDVAHAPFLWPTVVDGQTTLLQFYRDSLLISTSPTDTVRLQTRYQLQFSDSVYTREGQVAVYELSRHECRTSGPGICSPWVNTGSSAALLKDFTVTPLRANKSVASGVNDSHYLRVSFVMLPPYQSEKQTIRNLHWQSDLRIQPY